MAGSYSTTTEGVQGIGGASLRVCKPVIKIKSSLECQVPQESSISGASFSAIARQIAERAPGLNVVVSDSAGQVEFAAGPDVSPVGQREPGLIAKLKSWWRGTLE